MSDNLKREIDRLGSLNEPSFVFYGNGELAVLLPLVAHKLICLSCLVNNNFNLEKSMFTGNTYYQRHGVLCTSGRKADEVLPLQLMRELIILNDDPQATLTTEDDSENAFNTKDDTAETAASNADLTVEKAFKKMTVEKAFKKKAQKAAMSEKTAPTAAKVARNTQTVDSSTDKMVTRSSGRSK